ncbi:MAG: iron-sulfur cluster assembly scaffold protein [Candidatus Marsarchaeota archaeon]|nr:iron-sulfur cluster assembly scaffold protein [Candidatus Marsarchaeota archaeon]
MAAASNPSPAREQLYRANILEHYKHPHHWERLGKVHMSHMEQNPACGDEIGIELLLDKRGIIKNVGLWGVGCAISTAGADEFGRRLIGMTLAQAAKIDKRQVLADLGIDPGPTRMRCALLGLEGLRSALRKKENL